MRDDSGTSLDETCCSPLGKPRQLAAPDRVPDDGRVELPHDRRRREWLTEHVDIAAGPGIEVGALCSPLVTRSMGNVLYVDVQDTAGLSDHYRGDHAVRSEDLVDVDIALYANGRMRSVAEAAGDRGPFSWAVASHVIEHVPDLIGWLQDLAEALVDDGSLALVVPDRRYTFDSARPATTTGQLLAAHHRGDQRPSVRAVYDHFSATVGASAHDLWRGASPEEAPSANSPEALEGALARHSASDEYIDCHVWVFHAQELIRQLAELFDMGLHSFVVEAVRPTEPDDLEFFVLLRRIPRAVNAAGRGTLARAGFECPPHKVFVSSQPPPGLEVQLITPREWTMVQRKRQVLGPLARAVAAVRRQRRA